MQAAPRARFHTSPNSTASVSIRAFTELTIDGNKAYMRVVKDGLTGAIGVTLVGDSALVLAERAKAVVVLNRRQWLGIAPVTSANTTEQAALRLEALNDRDLVTGYIQQVQKRTLGLAAGRSALLESRLSRAPSEYSATEDGVRRLDYAGYAVRKHPRAGASREWSAL